MQNPQNRRLVDANFLFRSRISQSLWRSCSQRGQAESLARSKAKVDRAVPARSFTRQIAMGHRDPPVRNCR